MPIFDKNGFEIEHHNNFPLDLEVINIEFGAGRNNFGKREYPKCYLTDLSLPNLQLHFKNYIEYENEDCHFLDNVCNFLEYSFQRKFDNLIFCNPFSYGYFGLGNAKFFFDKAGDILKENGRIHIIGKSNNKWCKKEALDRFLKNEIPDLKSVHNFELEKFEELDNNHPIITNYQFYDSGLEIITIPNEKLTIKKL